MILHGLPSFSDLLFGLLWLLFIGLAVLTLFILGGLAIYGFEKKETRKECLSLRKF